jgi:hypothetical protein
VFKNERGRSNRKERIKTWSSEKIEETIRFIERDLCPTEEEAFFNKFLLELKDALADRALLESHKSDDRNIHRRKWYHF